MNDFDFPEHDDNYVRCVICGAIIPQDYECIGMCEDCYYDDEDLIDDEDE